MLDFITIQDTIIHYRVSKHASRHTPAAICIHGSGADSIVWSYQVSRLSKQFRIIAPDLPGHGQSEGTALDSAAAYAQWVDLFAQAMDINSFFLMGHSFGGAIVQEYAKLFPEKLMGMVLVATGTGFKLSQIYKELHETGIDAEAILSGTELPKHAAEFRQGIEMLLKVSGPTLHQDLLAAGSFDSKTWIASVEVPALVLWGNNDSITPRELPEQLASMLPEASFQIIDGAGHVIMVEKPAPFNAAVSEFMNRHC